MSTTVWVVDVAMIDGFLGYCVPVSRGRRDGDRRGGGCVFGKGVAMFSRVQMTIVMAVSGFTSACVEMESKAIWKMCVRCQRV